MKTRIPFLPLARIESRRWFCFTLMLALACLGAWRVPAANILWVSDSSPGIATMGVFSGPLSGLSDSGFVTLLQNAGHNVIRFNNPDANSTALTPAELTALNTNDLIILGRSAASAAFQGGAQGSNWNNHIIKPVLTINAYLARASRLGWFAASTQNDDTTTTVTAINTGDPRQDAIVDYIFGGVDMNGSTTADPYDELMDRNTSHITDLPVAGGTRLASADYTVDNGTPGTATVIAEWPAGTLVRGGLDILGSYRFYFAAASRESGTAPNTVSTYAGRENLTPTGESMFLRAVQVALNSGVPPVTNPLDPIGFTSPPASATILRGRPVTFSVALTGAPPRTVDWQRDTGDGMTFTNIPGATTTFTACRITLAAVDLADDNAKFRVVASNPNNSAASAVATLTVTADMAPPVVLSATSLEGTNISVCFDEKLEPMGAQDAFSYTVVDGMLGTAASTATLRPDGRTVDLATTQPLAPTFTLGVSGLSDLFSNGADAFETNCVNLGFTAVDVGTVNPAGSHFACNSNTFQVSGGGVNITGAADQLRFLYKTVEGNFDARVRVTALTGSDRLESYAKAALAAREDTSPGAGNITVFATPSYPGDNNVGTTVRTNAAGLTGNLGPVVGPNGLPSGWLRITRVGNVFTSYRSLDGMSWTQLGSISLTYGASMVVGAGVNSHRTGFLATGTFSDFSIATGPSITGLMYSAGIFSGSFQTLAGYSYQVQYKDNIIDTMWQVLTTIPGDGTVKPFTDPGPAIAQRFYRVAIQ